MSREVHARAEQLIAQGRVEGISAADQQWLRQHLADCASCAARSGATEQAIRSLRGFLAGGLPIGDRAFVFIIEAADNDAADKVVRSIPFWGVLQWKVTALQSVAGRATIERGNLAALKSAKP